MFEFRHIGGGLREAGEIKAIYQEGKHYFAPMKALALRARAVLERIEPEIKRQRLQKNLDELIAEGWIASGDPQPVEAEPLPQEIDKAARTILDEGEKALGDRMSAPN
jgi:hypothetical protein